MGVLAGKVAIITGAGTGVGAGEAYALAKEGAKVVLVGRTVANVETVAANVEAFGGEAMAMRCDVCRAEDIEAVVAATMEKYAQVDILINNAQIMPGQARSLMKWSEQDMRDMWESGFLGSWLFMKACFPHMKDRGGRIVNTCSGAGHGNIPGMSGYAAAKEAIRSLTRSAAREWGKYNILVNAISPFAPGSATLEHYDSEEKLEGLLDFMTSNGLAIRRIGDTEKDIGRTVVFLCGPDSGMITGCLISCDGGVAMI